MSWPWWQQRRTTSAAATATHLPNGCLELNLALETLLLMKTQVFTNLKN